MHVGVLTCPNTSGSSQMTNPSSGCGFALPPPLASNRGLLANSLTPGALNLASVGTLFTSAPPWMGPLPLHRLNPLLFVHPPSPGVLMAQLNPRGNLSVQVYLEYRVSRTCSGPARLDLRSCTGATVYTYLPFCGA